MTPAFFNTQSYWMHSYSLAEFMLIRCIYYTWILKTSWRQHIITCSNNDRVKCSGITEILSLGYVEVNKSTDQEGLSFHQAKAPAALHGLLA